MDPTPIPLNRGSDLDKHHLTYDTDLVQYFGEKAMVRDHGKLPASILKYIITSEDQEEDLTSDDIQEYISDFLDVDPYTSLFVVKVLSIVVIRPTCLAVIQRDMVKISLDRMDDSSGSIIGDYTPTFSSTDETATYRYSFDRPIAKDNL